QNRDVELFTYGHDLRVISFSGENYPELGLDFGAFCERVFECSIVLRHLLVLFNQMLGGEQLAFGAERKTGAPATYLLAEFFCLDVSDRESRNDSSHRLVNCSEWGGADWRRLTGISGREGENCHEYHRRHRHRSRNDEQPPRPRGLRCRSRARIE